MTDFRAMHTVSPLSSAAWLDSRNAVGLVGRTFRAQMDLQIAAPQYGEWTRLPEGCDPELELRGDRTGIEFDPPLPGRYSFTLYTTAGRLLNRTVIVFPTHALTFIPDDAPNRGRAGPYSERDKLLVLNNLANDPNFTADPLEAWTPASNDQTQGMRLVLGDRPVSLPVYGG